MIDLSREFTVEALARGFIISQDVLDAHGDVTDDTMSFAFTDFDDVLRFLAGQAGYDPNVWPEAAQ